MPGASWWVGSTGGGVASRGALGLAALLPRAEPLGIATPFDLASLTKPLATALLLVLLEQEGRVDLAEPIALRAPELRGSRWQDASLLALATHRSGLPAWAPLYLEADAPAALARSIACLEPAVEPGRVLYSDLGYLLLGIVIARAAGEGLDAAFDRRIAGPLGLERTGFATDRARFRDAAATEQGNRFEEALAGARGGQHPWRTHVLRGEVHDQNAAAQGGVAGHAGLFGPVEEVATIAREVVRPARLALSPRARARLVDVRAGGRSVGWCGAGWAAAARGILPDLAPGHTGFTGVSIWLDPPADRIFVLLTNRVHPSVSAREFALVRRGFHRIAARLLRGAVS
jgi:CubicO group peptidase (beta-lactamase class C family)